MTHIPRGFDPSITQPSPLTLVRVQCRRCIAEAVRDPGCAVCGGDVFRAVPINQAREAQNE